MQGVWTDGEWIASVGLDQRLRTWRIQGLHKSRASPPLPAQPPPADILLPQTIIAAGSTQEAAKAADLGADCPIRVEECECLVLQVLEPAALQVAPSEGVAYARQIAVVGRGTQVVLSSEEGRADSAELQQPCRE